MGSRDLEDLRLVRAQRRLVEHELDERRFGLFQRKVLLVVTILLLTLSMLAAVFDHALLVGVAATAGLGSGGTLMARSRDDGR